MIPKEGGNTFSANFLGEYAGEKFQGNNLSQELMDRGLPEQG